LGRLGKANGRAATPPRPAAKVRDYGAHVLVCTGGDCKKRGAKDTRKALKGELRAWGLLGEVRTDTTSCLGLCKHGPNVVVYDETNPKGTWYLGLDERDVPEVVEQHLVGGESVQRLAAERRARKARKK
jgi:(2Fe-2S) ferredoxin